jgi:hypothetical protein
MSPIQERNCKREMGWRPGDGPIKVPDCLQGPAGPHWFTRSGRCRWCLAQRDVPEAPHV